MHNLRAQRRTPCELPSRQLKIMKGGPMTHWNSELPSRQLKLGQEVINHNMLLLTAGKAGLTLKHPSKCWGVFFYSEW